jgi:hypothetical protein
VGEYNDMKRWGAPGDVLEQRDERTDVLSRLLRWFGVRRSRRVEFMPDQLTK